jgi:hypothetical protein
MTSQKDQESNMTQEFANTEIRALNADELEMVSGGSLFGSIEHAVSSVVHTVEHAATSVAQTVGTLAKEEVGGWAIFGNAVGKGVSAFFRAL